MSFEKFENRITTKLRLDVINTWKNAITWKHWKKAKDNNGKNAPCL